MSLFIDFLAQQWILVAALLVCISMFIFHESRRSGGSLSPQQMVTLVNREDAVVVDLRERAEYSKGHIVDAINIPYNKVNERMPELEKYKDKPLVLVCKMGQHSGAVGKNLGAKGFEKVYRLKGGMMEWSSMQLPLVKEEGGKGERKGEREEGAQGKRKKKKKGKANS